MHLLPVLFSVLAYLIHDFREKQHSLPIPRNYNSPLTFDASFIKLECVEVTAGEEVCIPITLGNIPELRAGQFTFVFESQNFEFIRAQNINPGLNATINNTVIIDQIAEGIVKFFWLGLDNISRDFVDSAILVEFCIKSKVSITNYDFRLSSSPIPIEFADSSGSPYPFGIPSGSIFSCSGQVIPKITCDRRSDSLELVRFYNATGGPNWNKTWNLNNTMDTWWGITLSPTGCISRIELADNTPGKCCDGNGLKGVIPNLNLPELTHIWCQSDSLQGPLPDFNKLVNLESLVLYGHQITGAIPNFILPKLRWLTLAGNKLQSITSLEKLVSLDYLDISDNMLTGIPPNFQLPKLTHLNISNNGFEGRVPDFTGIKMLKYYGLGGNKWSGSFPDLSNMPELETFDATNGYLTGPIPNFSKIPKLKTLSLTNNPINDIIPNFSNLPLLEGILMESCQLKGLLPDFNKCPQLKVIFLAYNNLEGYVPDYSTLMPLLSSLDLRENRFTFEDLVDNTQKIQTITQKTEMPGCHCPDSFVYHPQQKIYSDTTILIPSNTPYTLDLLIDDTVTTSTYTWYKNNVFYKTINGSNKLSFSPFQAADAGTYKVKIMNPLAPQLTLESHPIKLVAGPQLVCNRKSDSLELVKFYNATGGPSWTNKWDFIKPIDSMWGVKLNTNGCVSEINLKNNNLKDSLILLNLPELGNFTLASNQLAGNIPNFDSLPQLRRLELSDNQLEGMVPDFDYLPLLGELGLSHNKLFGAIPNFNKLPNLGGLTLSNNRLNGKIPNFNNLQLLELDLSENNLIGPLLDNSLTNPKLSRYWLFNNKLTFSDLVQNLRRVKKLTDTTNTQKGLYDSLIYAPQQKIYSDTTITIPPCSDYILDLKIDDTVTTSTYAWFKDSAPDTIIKGSNKRRFTNFNSAHVGTYTVKITNPLAPQLTLESHPIRLAVGTGLCCDRRSDSLELVKFYNSTGGPSNWWKKWDLLKPLNTWWGIELNPSGCVKTLRVSDTTLNGFTACCSGNNLVGTFPDIYLPELEVFHCQNNLGITGQIPNFNFPNLVELTVHTGMLSGGIPNFDKLPKLKILNLHRNKLTGPIPDFRHLPNLENLNLSVNALSGSIPDFPSFQNLKFLELYNNMLSGAIPDFSQMPNLTLLFLQSNQLSGTIPNFSNLSNLNYLGLGSNLLTGTIPNFNFLQINEIDLQNNKLTGGIPNFNSPKNLYWLWLNGNDLTEAVQDFTSILPGLALMYMENNKYTFSSLIDNIQKNKFHIDGTPKSNNVDDSLRYHPQQPIYFDTTITIPPCTDYTLDLKIDETVTTSTYAWFKDGVPDTIIKGSNKRRFTNFNTAHVGTYTVKITNPLAPQLTLESHPIRLAVGTGLCCDRRSDSLELVKFYNATDGPNWTKKWDFNKPIDSLWGVKLNINGCVQELQLIQNNLKGPLIELNLTELRFLDLPENNLEGNLPPFKFIKQVELINLFKNQFNGPIPNLDSNSKLVALKLSANNFSGNIPVLTTHKNLVELWLNDNDLIGFVPDHLKYNPNLNLCYYHSNRLTFSDLIKNLTTNKNLVEVTNNHPNNFSYAPQQKIYFDTTITIPPCTNYTLDLKIDDTVTTSTYTWFKDGSPLMTIKGSNKLTFSGFNSANTGTYTVFITNPLAPQLTLESHPIRLISLGAETNINNSRDTSLTCGLSFRLPVITGQNLGSDAAYFTGPGRTGTRYASGQSITADATLYVHTTSGGCFDEDTFSIRFTIPVLIARPDTVRTKAGKSVPFGVLDNDNIPAGLPTQVTIDNPSNGSILYSNSSGRGTYTPKIGFVGTEVLNYTVCIVDCPASCKSSILTLIVEGPCGDRNSIVLPNVIFPTGNGDNRYFIVEAISECPDAWGPKPHKLQVFNRWGNEVYRNDNYLNDWEGTNTSGQPLPEGTYYYLLDLGSVAAPVKGYVVIMR